MELLITAVVVIVLLLVFGVEPMVIVMGVLWLMEGLLVLMAVFFLCSALLLLAGRKRTGTFHHIEEEKDFAHAVYEVDGALHAALYPAEMLLREKIYHDGSHMLRMIRIGRCVFLFDRHSAHIIWIGLICSITGSVTLGYLLRLLSL